MMKIELTRMTMEEKLQAMEMLWDDFCRNAQSLSSPLWHKDILKDREESLAQGKEKLIDWDQAKNEIRDSVS